MVVTIATTSTELRCFIIVFSAFLFRRTCFYPDLGRLSLEFGELRFPLNQRTPVYLIPPGVVESASSNLWALPFAGSGYFHVWIGSWLEKSVVRTKDYAKTCGKRQRPPAAIPQCCGLAHFAFVRPRLRPQCVVSAILGTRWFFDIAKLEQTPIESAPFRGVAGHMAWD